MLPFTGIFNVDSLLDGGDMVSAGGAVGVCLRIELGACFSAEVALVIFGGSDIGVSLILTVDSTVRSVCGSSLPWRASLSEPVSMLVGEPGWLTLVSVSISGGRRFLGASSPSILLPGEPRAVRTPLN